MKKVALTSVAILSIIAGAVTPSTTAFAKKHSLKHQTLSSIVFKNGKLSGKAKAGSKISAYHGNKKMGSASIKRSSFTFKLKGVKNNWKIKLVATKKGYKKATKTVVAHVKTSKTGNYKPKSEYLSDHTLVTKKGNITFGANTRESDGIGGTNFLVFIRYTNTTSKMVSLSELLGLTCDARQSVGPVTKDLDTGYVDEDSQYYDLAQVVDDMQYVNPGQTVSTVATWTLDSKTAPVKLSLSAPDDDTTLGTITYY